MDKETSIRINFQTPKEALQAKILATTMLFYYRQNGRRFIPFRGMELENAGGFLYYESRKVWHEEADELRDMWSKYRWEYNPIRQPSGQAKDPLEYIRHEDCLFEMYGTDIPQGRDIGGHYFEDFFSMLCMILAAVAPDGSFDGMCRTAMNDHMKRILTRAVFDGKTLTFVQMEGSPVYDAGVLTWTVAEERFERTIYKCPYIDVKILSEDQEALKKDREIAEWIQRTNDAEAEMISAELCCTCGNVTYVRLIAGSRDVCVKYRDELLALLAGKGYAAKFFSVLHSNELKGPHIVVPDSVTAIGSKTFMMRTDLQSILIPDSVTEIDSYAFSDCISLKEIRIPDSVTYIGDFALSSCSGLRSVTLPGKLKAISCGLFCCCDALEEVAIRMIDMFAFSQCCSLTSVFIPDSVQIIKDMAFKKCTGLASIVIPERVTQIGADLFKDGNPDLIIRGKKGSAAACWAADNGFMFEEM